MSTTSIGRLAESAAAAYLKQKYSLELIAQNWRTRTCEIDLIMQNDKEIYFIEVKYRKNNFAGGGLQSISKTKLNQMHLAMQEWLAENADFDGHQLHLSAIELHGKEFKVSQFIPDINLDS